MSRALLATAALHTYSCGANLCDLCELSALFQAVGQCSDAHHGNNLQPIHRIFEVLKKKKKCLRGERGIEVTAGCSASL